MVACGLCAQPHVKVDQSVTNSTGDILVNVVPQLLPHIMFLGQTLGQMSLNVTQFNEATRRSRGAMGRVRRPTGAAAAAAGVPRWPTDGSDGVPARERG